MRAIERESSISGEYGEGLEKLSADDRETVRFAIENLGIVKSRTGAWDAYANDIVNHQIPALEELEKRLTGEHKKRVRALITALDSAVPEGFEPAERKYVEKK